MSVVSSHPKRTLAFAIWLALGSVETHAATITVTTGGDAGDVSTCTLRQAVDSANNDASGTSACVAGNGTDTIAFAPALANSTITLGGSEIYILTPLTITGSGQTIDPNHLSRAIHIDADATIANLTITNGAYLFAGGIMIGSGTVGLDHIAISNCAATGSSGGGLIVDGGASVTLTNSSITGNTVVDSGGGLLLSGAGTTVTLNASNISGNTSHKRGAGIYVGYSGTTLTLNNSTVANNTILPGGAIIGGAGIYAANCDQVLLRDSAVYGNTSHYQGGGILTTHISVSPHLCPLSVINTTISGNTSVVSGGGGVYVINGAATIVDSTISGNNAAEAGGLLAYGASATLKNTIVSGNSAHPNYTSTNDLAAYHSATIAAQYSLFGSALNAAPLNAAGNHNVFTDTPGLGPLQNNSGTTPTMAVLAGSAAIDAGSNALIPVPLLYDQRVPRFLRIFNARVDIGAFEYQGDRIFASPFDPPP